MSNSRTKLSQPGFNSIGDPCKSVDHFLQTPAIAHDIEGKPFVTGGVDDGEVTDSAEILDSGGDLWLPYEHANVSPTEAYWRMRTGLIVYLCMITFS